MGSRKRFGIFEVPKTKKMKYPKCGLELEKIEVYIEDGKSLRISY